MTAGNGLAVAAGYKRKEFGVEAACIRESSKQFAEPGRPENRTPQDNVGIRQLVSAQTGFGLW
jgi:hypothetical protein